MRYKHKDWIKEIERRFGKDPANWAFKCPACRKVSTGAEYRDVGKQPNTMFYECIGRFLGKGAPKKNDSTGCNWVSYGLFGTVGRGDVVEMEDGSEIDVFEMGDDPK